MSDAGMIYTIQFQRDPGQEPCEDVNVFNARAIPRQGETVDVDGEVFEVIAVFHGVEYSVIEKRFWGSEVTVRVR